MARLLRVLIDSSAALLLFLSMAYYWLGNLSHELFGTALFGVLALHNWRNRHWYASLFKGRYNLRRTVGLLANLSTLMVMLVLLGTSLAISRTLFTALPLNATFSLKEIHWFAAWWSLVIIGIHVGIHWPKLSALLRIPKFPTYAIAEAVLLYLGWKSAEALDIWTRLSLQYSLNFWDFNESALPFFAHLCVFIISCAVLTHIIMRITSFRAQIMRNRLFKQRS